MMSSLESDQDDAKTRLKRAAQDLFARNGIDAVTIRQIVTAAGQRNNAALHYHYGTKEDLVRQLLIEGAQQIDSRRQEMLAAIDAAGGPRSVQEVLRVLVLPVIELELDSARKGYIRLVANVQTTHRALLRSALGDRWNAGYVRCLDLLRALIITVPPKILEQRLSFLGMYSNAFLSARDAALDSSSPIAAHRFWGLSYTTDNFLDTLEALLTCPPSRGVLDELEGHA